MPRIRPFDATADIPWPLPPRKQAGSTAHDKTSVDSAEPVRQWLIREITTTYGYPQDWLGKRLRLLNLRSGESKENGTLAASLSTDDGLPFLILVAAPHGKARQAEEALRAALLRTDTAGIGVSSDGTTEGTVFLRRRFDASRCEYLPDIEPYLQKTVASTLFAAPETRGHGATVDDLVPLSDRIENLFFELHSHIRDIDGLHADEALDELCKLLYVKLYDEERAAAGSPLRLRREAHGSTEEFAATIRGMYLAANEYDLRVFRLKIPQYERSRGVFNAPLKLSGPAAVRVMDDLQSYSLTRSDADVKGRAFQRVLAPTVRSGMGQYFTPEPIIGFIVETVRPSVSDLILDPFCGSAHFLSRSLQHVRSSTKDIDSKTFHEFAFGKLHGIEKSDRMVRVAMTDMRLHGDGHSNIRCTDALLDFANYPDLEQEMFDVILTNPPFGSLLSAESISQLGKFDLAKGRKRVPLEVLGLERCLQFLRPGGRMAIVLPDSVLTNRGTRYVREWIEGIAMVRAIISLPVETFTPFGANIKTSVLYLRKWDRGELRSRSYPTCLVRVDNVGYDANGRPNDKADLKDASEKLREFIDKEGW